MAASEYFTFLLRYYFISELGINYCILILNYTSSTTLCTIVNDELQVQIFTLNTYTLDNSIFPEVAV